MTPDELLRPRYKVIADYPGCPYPVGTVLYVDEHGELYSPIAGYAPTLVRIEEKFVNDFPHLIQPLQWWEERKPEDMPEYVKCIKTPDQIIMPGDVMKVTWNSSGGRVDNGPWIFPYTNCYLPATFEEYTTYIKSLKQEQ